MKKSINLHLITPALVFMAVIISSCGGKKNNNQKIIIHKEKPSKKVETTQKTGDYTQTRNVKWLNENYDIQVSRKASASLPAISQENSGTKYFDNEITLKILRTDGSEFFSRTFTKTDFTNYVDAAFMKKSALLGVVYYKVEGSNLVFVASIGLPDKLSDEYVPLLLKISNHGTLSTSKDAQLDTSGNNEDDEN